MKFNILYPIFALCFLLGLASCENEFTTNPNDKLLFSTDTLAFDTVFTTIGTRTEVIKVFNPASKAINISAIGLEKGSNSVFKINVDGETNKNYQFSNIEISARDSMYIFVTVYIDPNNNNSPLIAEDKLFFSVNGNSQSIHLEAYGQDVEILRNRYILSDSTLTADKPYLIYDTLFVAPTKTLTIQAGARLYFHKNASLVVYGNIDAIGTLDAPIEMRGDRLDKVTISYYPVPYNNIAGQWTGVLLLGNAGNHHFNHVKINSSDVGIYLYNTDKSTLPSLKIENSRLHNFSLYGLLAVNGNVEVTNSEISNSGNYLVYMNGGKHTFIHCTIANFFGGSYQANIREGNAAVMVNNLEHEARMESVFKNCVVYGSLSNEFSLLTNFPTQYNADISDSYIRRTDTTTFSQFSNIRWYHNNDIVFRQTKYDFEKPAYFDFDLDSVSPARAIGDLNITTLYNLEMDINGTPRPTSGNPDAGAYQWKSRY